MIQSPCVQSVPPIPQYKQDLNAVKIEIVNPTAGAPGMPLQNPGTVTCPAGGYSNPTAPIYQYPQAPIYTYPQQPGQVYYPPAAPQQVNVNNPTGQPPVAPTAPAAPAEVPAPQVSTPEVVPPVPVKPELDLNAFLARLSSPDFETQRAAIEEVSQILKEDQAAGTNRSDALYDRKVFDEFVNILNTDSSQFEGPTQAQIDARQKHDEGKELTEEEKALVSKITPMESAERNKCYALYAIAMLNKRAIDEVLKVKNEVPALTALPDVTDIVNQLKDNPNPIIRSSAIEALSYIQRPEYSKDLRTLFEIAKKDQNPDVAKTAEVALNKLNEISQ